MIKRRSIAAKLLVSILFISSVATFLFTGFAFYMDYLEEVKKLEGSVDHINKSILKPLAASVYYFDEEQTRTQVEGMLTLPDIYSVSITNAVSGNKITRVRSEQKEVGMESRHNRFTGRFVAALFKGKEFLHIKSPLINAEGKEIGQLEYQISRINIFKRIFTRVSIFFVSQGVKTTIVSVLILLLFRHLLIRHLYKIKEYVLDLKDRHADLSNLDDLELDRKKSNYPDEIDEVAESISFLAKEIELHNSKQSKALEAQKLTTINSARLASMGEMAGGVAHEINNPLSIILGNSQLIQRISKDLPEDNRKRQIIEAAERMNLTVRRIEGIVKGLLAFSRDGAKEKYLTQPVVEILEDVAAMCTERMKSCHIKFSVNIDSDSRDSMVFCNKIQIGQVLINLINNARDALDGHGSKSINLAAAFVDGGVEFAVIDNGNGIPAELLPKILEPFFSTKPIGQGTGLGLSISYGLIEEHNSVLKAESRPGYTKFSFVLPLKKSDTMRYRE